MISVPLIQNKFVKYISYSKYNVSAQGNMDDRDLIYISKIDFMRREPKRDGEKRFKNYKNRKSIK